MLVRVNFNEVGECKQMAGVCARARVVTLWGYLGGSVVPWRRVLNGQVFFDVFAVHLGLVALGDDFAS